LEDVRARIRAANSDFQEYMRGFADKKAEYHLIKKMNDDEREQIKKEQKQANSFKFTKMTKRHDFLPAFHSRGFLDPEPPTSIDNHVQYMPGIKKERLIAPDRIHEKRKFSLVSSHANYFSKPVG
jgi:hypothetical protein